MEFTVCAAVLLLVCIMSRLSTAIPLGELLLAGNRETWGSSQFVFGFRQSGTLYNLAIWYLHSPEVAVWTATNPSRRTQVVEARKGSQLVITTNGLLIKDGNKTLWNTTFLCTVNDSDCVTEFLMEGTGNAVLLSKNGERLWESFSFPTDTLLPQQVLAGNGSSLVSGKYTLILNETCMGLYANDYGADSYWRFPTGLDKAFKRGFQPQLSSMYIPGQYMYYDANGTEYDIYSLNYRSKNQLQWRMKLEPDGNLRIYSFSDETGWIVDWQALLLECNIFRTCGDFGLCTYNPTKRCICPSGFSPVDERDSTAGCKHNMQLECSKVKLVEVTRADYQVQSYNRTIGLSLEGCKKRCLEDCKCLGASYGIDGGACELKAALFNGVRSAIGGQKFRKIALIKISAEDSSSTLPRNDMFVTFLNATPGYRSNANDKKHPSLLSSSRHKTLTTLVAGEFAVICMAAVLTALWWRRATQKMVRKFSKEKQGASLFSYKQLEVATNGFADKLGGGGFGSVYKGALVDKTPVAVKVLNDQVTANQGQSYFRAEVNTLGRVHHVNLVKLLGYCAEGKNRLLVYQFMPNGSLDKALSMPIFNKLWKTRYNVALGIARGIAYLHEGCYQCILHCDIKPENILLDQDFVPKVSDFGLAKLTKESALSVTTIRGTRGYLAPEWISKRPISAKVDVYSYGMVLLELLTGDYRSKFEVSSFQGRTFQKYLVGEMNVIADVSLERSSVDWKEFERVLKVAIWCVQVDASSRPSMSRVVRMLEGHDSEILAPSFSGEMVAHRDVHESAEELGSLSILQPR